MFTVTWPDEARDQLAAIWLKCDSRTRHEITTYAADVDRHLRANADRIGESREPGIRILAEVILGIEFRVSVLDRVTSIDRVWRIPPTKSNH